MEKMVQSGLMNKLGFIAILCVQFCGLVAKPKAINNTTSEKEAPNPLVSKDQTLMLIQLMLSSKSEL